MTNIKRSRERILRLLDDGRLIRVLDGRCRDEFVDLEALRQLIKENLVDTYRVNGSQFVRAKKEKK